MQEVCAVAEEHGLLIVCDEIYRDLAYEPEALRSPASILPEHVFVTNGLSKSMALGGWRIGFCRLPQGPLGADAARALTGVASEVWSSLAAPMQHAATYVLDEPADVREHVARSRRLHRLVATAAHARVVGAGAICRAPTGAFYLYPDLEPLRPALAAQGVSTGAQLAALLLERHDVAVLEGAAFGDDPAALRFRMATSLLYGSRRRAALGGARRRRSARAAVDRRRAGAPRRGAPRAAGVVLRPPRRATPRTWGRPGWRPGRGGARPTRTRLWSGSLGSLGASIGAASPRRAASSVAISTRRSSRGPAISRIGAWVPFEVVARSASASATVRAATSCVRIFGT